MALTLNCLLVLKEILRRSRTVFSLGYPDLLMSPFIAKKHFGVDVGIHPENEKAKRQHSVNFDLVDTEDFFSALDIEFSCCDLVKLRGPEIIADLNEAQDFGQFDLVIDAGTIEHCFNIAQAAFNAANAVKPGGVIFHGNPLTMVNHGFYCLSPTWYADFYEDNGWGIALQATMGKGSVVRELEFPLRRNVFEPELSNICIAIKPTNPAPLKYPTQSKYKAMLAKSN